MKVFLVSFLFVLLYSNLLAQKIAVENFQNEFQIHITQINIPVKIDGVLDDSIWSIAEKKTNFYMKFPTDEGTPKSKTIVQLAHDDHFLYVAFTSYDSGKSIIQSLKRDIGFLIMMV